MSANSTLDQWVQAVLHAFVLFWLLWAAGQARATTLTDTEYILMLTDKSMMEMPVVLVSAHVDTYRPCGHFMCKSGDVRAGMK
jgi:hypothetical protein